MMCEKKQRIPLWKMHNFEYCGGLRYQAVATASAGMYDDGGSDGGDTLWRGCVETERAVNRGMAGQQEWQGVG
jgi:hypothetical protein